MKLFKKMRKGFTLIELVVVIAVIAILSAVAVVSYISITNRAKESNDHLVLDQINTSLLSSQILEKKATVHEIVERFDEEEGYDVRTIKPELKNARFVYSYENGKFGYWKDNKVAYPADLAKIDFTGSNDLWFFEDEAKDTYDDSYSHYLKAAGTVTSITAKGGIDVGGCTTISSINFTRTTNAAKPVVIRTNSAKTTLKVNAPSDDVHHYGALGALNIVKANTASYHENGKVAYVEIAYGRIVLEKGADVEEIHINKKTESSFDTVIIANNGGAEELPERITRDAVTVSEQQLVVTVESNGTSEQVFVYASGASGTTQKVTEGENKQNETVNSALGQLVLDNGSNPGEKAQTSEQKEAAKTEAVENAQAQEIVADFWISIAADSFASGSGTEQDPFMISNATHLARIAKLINSYETNETYSNSNVYYKLANNIDLSGKAWTPIGINGIPFRANFDGGSHDIIGLTNNGHDADDLTMVYSTLSTGITGASGYGLFGYVDGAVISNFTLKKVDINSDTFKESAMIVGCLKGSLTMTNCDISSDSSIYGSSKIGGFIGRLDGKNDMNIVLTGCDMAGSVYATSNGNTIRAGGIVAACACTGAKTNVSFTISNCSVSGKVEAKDYSGFLFGDYRNTGNSSSTRSSTEYTIVTVTNTSFDGELSATHTGVIALLSNVSQDTLSFTDVTIKGANLTAAQTVYAEPENCYLNSMLVVIDETNYIFNSEKQLIPQN